MAPYVCGIQMCGTDFVDSNVDPPHFADGYPICTECSIEKMVPLFELALKHEACYPPPWGDERLDVDSFADILAANIGPDFVRQYKDKEQYYAVPLADRRLCKHVVLKEEQSDPDYCNEQLAPITVATHGQDLQCNVCANMSCGKCVRPLDPWRSGHICETQEERAFRIAKEKQDQEEQLKDLTRGKDYQICPGAKCGSLYYLGDACNHMHCHLRCCRAEFCYNCGEKTSDLSHWGDNGRCPLYGYQPVEPREPLGDAMEIEDEVMEDGEPQRDSDEGTHDLGLEQLALPRRRPISDLETNHPDPPVVTNDNHPDGYLERNDDVATIVSKIPAQPDFARLRLRNDTEGMVRMHIETFFTYVADYALRTGEHEEYRRWQRERLAPGLISFRLFLNERNEIWHVEFGRDADTILEHMSSRRDVRRINRLLQDDWLIAHLTPIMVYCQGRTGFARRGAPRNAGFRHSVPLLSIPEEDMDFIERELESWTLLPPSRFADQNLLVKYDDFMTLYYLLARRYNEPIPVALEPRDSSGPPKWLRISLRYEPQTGEIQTATIVALFEPNRVRSFTRALMQNFEQVLFGEDGQQNNLTWMMQEFRTDPDVLFLGRFHELPAGFNMRLIPGAD